MECNRGREVTGDPGSHVGHMGGRTHYKVSEEGGGSKKEGGGRKEEEGGRRRREEEEEEKEEEKEGPNHHKWQFQQTQLYCCEVEWICVSVLCN